MRCIVLWPGMGKAKTLGEERVGLEGGPSVGFTEKAFTALSTVAHGLRGEGLVR